MITITYDTKHMRLTVDGHAGYAPAGQDIVCAAVSALTWTLAAAVAPTGGAELSPGHSVLTGTDAAAPLFDCICTGLVRIARQYPKHVKVEIV